MNVKDITEAVAILDGFTDLKYCPEDLDGPAIFEGEKDGRWPSVPNYPHSRDAIMPVIQKHVYGKTQSLFLFHIGNIVTNKSRIHLSPDEHCMAIMLASPTELCEALLKATHKWRD